MDLVLLGALWGASFLFLRIATPEFGPVPIIFVRVGVAAVLLGVMLAARGGLGALSAHTGALCLLGAINTAVPFTLFAFATMELSAGLASVLNATVPLFSAVVAVIWIAHPVLGMTAAASAVVMLVLALLNDLLTQRDIEALQKAAAGATRYLESSLQNAEVAQTMGMTDALIARWRARNLEVSELQRPTASRSVAMTALTRAVRQAVQVLMLAVGAYLVITAQSTPGVMIAARTAIPK